MSQVCPYCDVYTDAGPNQPCTICHLRLPPAAPPRNCPRCGQSFQPINPKRQVCDSPKCQRHPTQAYLRDQNKLNGNDRWLTEKEMNEKD
jgi:hypothetical protein